MKYKYDILVPTCKLQSKLMDFTRSILDTTDTTAGDLIMTHKQVSAAVNRNYALEYATAPVVIMLDDDISGFYPGWDRELVEALMESESHVMVSARLMHTDGTPGIMMNFTPDMSCKFQYTQGFLPSSCIAFRNDGSRFDENFIGSGWEDTDFCETLQKRYPAGQFLIANGVKLVHANEMKQGNRTNYVKNHQYYIEKHGRIS